MTIEELRILAGDVEPLPMEALPAAVIGSALAFNGLVSRFRELVVRARNGLVLERGVPPEIESELLALARSLPGERLRAGAPPAADGSAVRGRPFA